MDTAEVSKLLGTTPRILRAFLRSDYSTYSAVGSGARYQFTARDIPTLTTRFSEWSGAGKPRPDSGATKAKKPVVPPTPEENDEQRLRDELVWREEGPVVLEDIRNPRVRRQVKERAKAAEDRLALRLMSVGLYLTQIGDRS